VPGSTVPHGEALSLSPVVRLTVDPGTRPG
jgi:hypothetical protein